MANVRISRLWRFPTFASKCCCKERPKDANVTAAHLSATDRVELWICENGMRKERLREGFFLNQINQKMVYQNGSKLRPFCGREFPKGFCEPKYDADAGRYKVYVC